MMNQKHSQINIVLHNQSNQSSTHKQTTMPLIDQTFSSFVGMDELKRTIQQIYATKVINGRREQIGLNCKSQVLHMLFKGNPGTGKTTIARKLAQFYYDINLLSKGHFIEAERADVVGEYIGQTAQKTRALIQKARGGILFIDEAYALARGGDKDFGREAIDTMVSHMENHHDDFVLILAGYSEEMETFLALNPGLESRFPFILNFRDFTIDQLLKIAKQMVAEREYELIPEAEWKLRKHLLKLRNKTYEQFSNARYVRNLIEHSIRMHATRLMNKETLTANDLIELTAEDFIFDAHVSS